jgi:LmbE family N-acetylglucosaminyl deacetylase
MLVFGAHPDDVEFGCGGVVALEARMGRRVHLVVCSRGEAGTNGTPAGRTSEAQHAAAIMGATIEFIELDGDAHLEMKAAHAIQLASIIRRERPAIVLAPSTVENQHPDHSRLGRLTRDATRLARFGGLTELRALPPHSIGQLFYYALSHDAEPRDISPVLIDISDPEIIRTWTAAMEAHASQSMTRNYIELQLLRARALGARAGLSHATAMYPADPVVVASLGHVGHGARRF